MAEPTHSEVSANSSAWKIRLTKPTSTPTEDAISLLKLWNLSQLSDKFQEQEVCTIAFQHITDADISELIPKIGPRAIFRARLSEWRLALQKQRNASASQLCLPSSNGQDKRKRHNQTAFTADDVAEASNPKKKSNTNNFAEPTVIKMETMNIDEQQWLREVEEFHDAVAADTNEDESLLDTFPPPSTPNSSLHQVHEGDEDLLNDSDFLPDENNVTTDTAIKSGDNSNCPNSPTSRQNSEFRYSQHNHEQVNVKNLLSNSYDGRKAIEFYASNKHLEINHRKLIVKCIISVVIERRVIMTVSCFHDLAQQLIDMFPNENHDTYYVPRIGMTCPRGALYNKYLNMCRHLRRNGLLEYRVQKRGITSKT